MTIGKTLSACALAMAVGATALMAVPDHANAQSFAEFKPTTKPKIPPVLIEGSKNISRSSSCSFTASDGSPVKHNVDLFFEVNSDLDLVLFKGFRLHTDTETHANFFAYLFREGINNPNKPLVKDSSVDIRPLTLKGKDGKPPQQQNVNVNQGFPTFSKDELELKGVTFEFFLSENFFPTNVCGTAIAFTDRKAKRVVNEVSRP